MKIFNLVLVLIVCMLLSLLYIKKKSKENFSEESSNTPPSTEDVGENDEVMTYDIQLMKQIKERNMKLFRDSGIIIGFEPSTYINIIKNTLDNDKQSLFNKFYNVFKPELWDRVVSNPTIDNSLSNIDDYLSNKWEKIIFEKLLPVFKIISRYINYMYLAPYQQLNTVLYIIMYYGDKYKYLLEYYNISKDATDEEIKQYAKKYRPSNMAKISEDDNFIYSQFYHKMTIDVLNNPNVGFVELSDVNIIGNILGYPIMSFKSSDTTTQTFQKKYIKYNKESVDSTNKSNPIVFLMTSISESIKTKMISYSTNKNDDVVSVMTIMAQSFKDNNTNLAHQLYKDILDQEKLAFDVFYGKGSWDATEDIIDFGAADMNEEHKICFILPSEFTKDDFNDFKDLQILKDNKVVGTIETIPC